MIAHSTTQDLVSGSRLVRARGLLLILLSSPDPPKLQQTFGVGLHHNRHVSEHSLLVALVQDLADGGLESYMVLVGCDELANARMHVEVEDSTLRTRSKWLAMRTRTLLSMSTRTSNSVMRPLHNDTLTGDLIFFLPRSPRLTNEWRPWMTRSATGMYCRLAHNLAGKTHWRPGGAPLDSAARRTCSSTSERPLSLDRHDDGRVRRAS